MRFECKSRLFAIGRDTELHISNGRLPFDEGECYFNALDSRLRAERHRFRPHSLALRQPVYHIDRTENCLLQAPLSNDGSLLFCIIHQRIDQQVHRLIDDRRQSSCTLANPP